MNGQKNKKNSYIHKKNRNKTKQKNTNCFYNNNYIEI